MPLHPRWEELFAPFASATSHLFKVWTLPTDDARAFQRQWNARLDERQPKRYVASVDEGDFYGVALAMCDLFRDRETRESAALVLLREAVELLHMLAHVVELPLWRQIFVEAFALKDEWAAHVVPVWAFLPYDVMARSVEVANKDMLSFVGLLERTERSSLYATAKAQIWEIVGIDADPRLQQRVPKTLEMWLMLTPPISEFVPREKLDEHLRELHVALSLARQVAYHQQGLSMRVTNSIVTVTLGQDDVDARCLSELATLCAVTPIGFLDIHLKPAASDRGKYPWAAWGKLLDHVALDRRTANTARHLGVTVTDGDLRRFAAVCSAVHESHCIGEFAVYAGLVSWPRDQWLRWLAWSWLSATDKHTELKLVLNVNAITEEDVAELQDVLNGGNPLGADAPRVWWAVTTADVDAACAVDDGDDAAIATTTIPQGTRLAVVGETGSHTLRVLMPGYGVVAIDRSATEPLSSGVSPLRSRVTALNLDGLRASASMEGAVALVQLLSSTLTSLQVVCRGPQLQQTHVAAILAACPRLTRLKLSGMALTTMDFVVDAYSALVSAPTELILNDVRLTDPRGADGFVAALATPTHRMASTLRVEGVGFSDDARVDATLVDHVYAMLDANRYLQGVQVRFPSSLRPREWRAVASYGVGIARPGTMLSLEQKFALLGALQAPSSTATARALARDELALGNVLAFAAEQAVRWASITFN